MLVRFLRGVCLRGEIRSPLFSWAVVAQARDQVDFSFRGRGVLDCDLGVDGPEVLVGSLTTLLSLLDRRTGVSDCGWSKCYRTMAQAESGPRVPLSDNAVFAPLSETSPSFARLRLGHQSGFGPAT